MERLAGGIVHIPIFLNTLQPGLYYAQILVCSSSRTIPYDGPNEDLDIGASYVIPASGGCPFLACVCLCVCLCAGVWRCVLVLCVSVPVCVHVLLGKPVLIMSCCPPAGLIFSCGKDVDTTAWSGLGATVHEGDAEGLDLVVAGIEPFSEVCVCVC